MKLNKLGVGIIGASPNGGWGSMHSLMIRTRLITIGMHEMPSPDLLTF
jgi:hypothetical protein